MVSKILVALALLIASTPGQSSTLKFRQSQCSQYGFDWATNYLKFETHVRSSIPV